MRQVLSHSPDLRVDSLCSGPGVKLPASIKEGCGSERLYASHSLASEALGALAESESIITTGRQDNVQRAPTQMCQICSRHCVLMVQVQSWQPALRF